MRGHLCDGGAGGFEMEGSGREGGWVRFEDWRVAGCGFAWGWDGVRLMVRWGCEDGG